MLKEAEGNSDLMEQERLDIISDVMALTSCGNVKNIILVTVEAVGAFDKDVFALAVRRASAKLPVLTSHLREIREKGQHFLVRGHPQELHVPVFMGQLSKSNRGEATFDSLISHMIPRLDRDWNLFLEPPVEIHVLSLGDNHFVFVLLMHHSAGDVEAILAVLRAVMGEYEAVVSGEAPLWLENPYVSSTSKKRESAQRRFGWKDFLSRL